MVNRDSKAYRFGKFCGRVVLIGIGYLIGKRWGRRPIDDFRPKN